MALGLTLLGTFMITHWRWLKRLGKGSGSKSAIRRLKVHNVRTQEASTCNSGKGDWIRSARNNCGSKEHIECTSQWTMKPEERGEREMKEWRK